MKASVEHIRSEYAFTERRACRLLLVPVSSYRYKPRGNDDGLCERLVALAREKPRFGYRRLHVLLEREGRQVNYKRVHRVYREAGLALRRKKRKHYVRTSAPLGMHIQPGKPTQNGYVESFNGKLREECLRVNWFQNLFEARCIIATWRRDYNERRPHSSLNYLTPAEFAAKTSRGKDGDSVRLENAHRVSHFPTAAAAS
jgi:transposase InsO family protein